MALSFAMRSPFIATALALACAQAFAAPTGGNVVAGSAEIRQHPNGSQTDVVQSSQRAVIEWSSFNVRNGEGVYFRNDAFGRNSWTLNRINDAKASDISGRIWGVGNIILLNSNGVIFNQDARVDAGGLIASTARLSNEDFMAGRLNFTASERFGGSIINRGTINIADSGIAMLVAPHVRNDGGVIYAKLGKVTLASGSSFTVDLAGDGLINLALRDGDVQNLLDADGKKVDALIENRNRDGAKGRIVAPSGKIVVMTPRFASGLVDNAINLGGVVRADGVEKLPGGEIRLVAANGSVDLGGEIAAPRGAGTNAGLFTFVREDAALVVDGSTANAVGRILSSGTNVSLEAAGANLEVQQRIDGRGGADRVKLELHGSSIEIKNDILLSNGAFVADASDGSFLMTTRTEEIVRGRQLPVILTGEGDITVTAKRDLQVSHLLSTGAVALSSRAGDIQIFTNLGYDIVGPLGSLTVRATGDPTLGGGDVARMHDVRARGRIDIEATRNIRVLSVGSRRPGLSEARGREHGLRLWSRTLGNGSDDPRDPKGSNLAFNTFYWAGTNSQFLHIEPNTSPVDSNGRWIELGLTKRATGLPTPAAPPGPNNLGDPGTYVLGQLSNASSQADLPDVLPAVLSEVTDFRGHRFASGEIDDSPRDKDAGTDEEGYSGGRGLAAATDTGRKRAVDTPTDPFRLREHVVEASPCRMPTIRGNAYFTSGAFGQAFAVACN